MPSAKTAKASASSSETSDDDPTHPTPPHPPHPPSPPPPPAESPRAHPATSAHPSALPLGRTIVAPPGAPVSNGSAASSGHGPSQSVLESKIRELRHALIGAQLSSSFSDRLGGSRNRRGFGGRLHSGYDLRRGSADAELEYDRADTLAMSRAVHRFSGVARGMIERWVDLVVGTGLTPRGTNPAAREAVKQFEAWSLRDADIRGQTTFGGLQRLVARDLAIAGDILAIRTIADGRQSVQLVEAERITDPGGKGTAANDPSISDGVQMNEWGRPVIYHVASYGAGGSWVRTQTMPVDARHSSLIAHRTRVSQTRGEPMLQAVLKRIGMQEDSYDAVAAAINLAAMLAIFITAENAASKASMVQTGTQRSQTAGGPPLTQSLMNVEPATILTIESGEMVQTVTGAQPSTGFDVFDRIISNIVAVNLGAPVEVLLMDNSKANFSVSKSAELQAQSGVKPVRDQIRCDLCIPTYEWFAADRVSRGLLPDDPAIFEVEWDAPARLSTDPVKQTFADQMAIENNIVTREEVIRSRGGDPDAVAEKTRRRGRARPRTRHQPAHDARREADGPVGRGIVRQRTFRRAGPD